MHEFERRAGRPAADLLDLIVGTSTGGIIGIGLAIGRSAEELADFYPRYGRTIFGGSNTGAGWRQRLFVPTGDFGKTSRAVFGSSAARSEAADHQAAMHAIRSTG